MQQAHHLVVDSVTKSFDGNAVLSDVSLSVALGKTLALLGPSGSGKTTLLRIIAGLETPDAGGVRIDDEVLTDADRVVAPERRNVGLVFQDGALFPHMSVGDNVGYGLAPANRSAKVATALAMVDLTGFENRKPHTLSGGQARRVAIARALAPEPRVLLLDEPFSNLDTELRVRVRTDVARLLNDVGITSVFVTHDQEEAFVVGDEVAVMNRGTIIQTGAPAEIYQQPATAWVARFVGDANVFAGHVQSGVAETLIGPIPVADHTEGLREVMVRPEQLVLSSEGEATVIHVEFYGHDTSYKVQVGRSEVLVRSISAPRYRIGDRVKVSYQGTEAITYPGTVSFVRAS
ncbi:MAG: ABC transporter ATP-binding protein [Acidimicrobiia bacterium]|nr:ABC transporter ATP-binding protein [Acidimicrobiia bacterium]